MIRLGEREGSFVPERRSGYLKLRSASTRPIAASVYGEGADWRYEEAEKMLVVQLVEHAGEMVVGVDLPAAF